MTIFGWVFMIFSWGCILALVVFCFSRIFRRKERD